jgi:hypothetical protein
MVRTRGPDRWRFPLFLEDAIDPVDDLPGEVSGGSSRMRAIQAIYEQSLALENYELLVLVTGGTERDGSSRADEAVRQLVSRYGLPGNAVVSIRGAGSTIGNAKATVEYIGHNPHVRGAETPIEIVTNDYHMLRAWIIFSKEIQEGMRRLRLSISPNELKCIRQILINGFPKRGEWFPSRIRKDREQVMSLLRPHFSGAVNIAPLVVEEILEDRSLCPQSAQRYARRLRNSVWVRRTLHVEYERIMKLLGMT